MNGGNFEPSFLKLNLNATLPTLAAGSNTYTDTKSVVSYLNSIASSPVAKATAFTDLIHEDKYDPNFALLLAVNWSLLHTRLQTDATPYRGMTRSLRLRPAASLDTSSLIVRRSLYLTLLYSLITFICSDQVKPLSSASPLLPKPPSSSPSMTRRSHPTVVFSRSTSTRRLMRPRTDSSRVLPVMSPTSAT